MNNKVYSCKDCSKYNPYTVCRETICPGEFSKVTRIQYGMTVEQILDLRGI